MQFEFIAELRIPFPDLVCVICTYCLQLLTSTYPLINLLWGLFFLISFDNIAFSRFILISWYPDNFSRVGLTNNSNVVKAAVGFPDRLITIDLFTLLHKTADPGLIVIFQKSFSPLVVSIASFNKSFLQLKLHQL